MNNPIPSLHLSQGGLTYKNIVLNICTWIDADLIYSFFQLNCSVAGAHGAAEIFESKACILHPKKSEKMTRPARRQHLGFRQ